MTRFGEVTVKRKGYSTAAMESLFPLDGELNLPQNKYSHGLRHRMGKDAHNHRVHKQCVILVEVEKWRFRKHPGCRLSPA